VTLIQGSVTVSRFCRSTTSALH